MQRELGRAVGEGGGGAAGGRALEEVGGVMPGVALSGEEVSGGVLAVVGVERNGGGALLDELLGSETPLRVGGDTNCTHAGLPGYGPTF